MKISLIDKLNDPFEFLGVDTSNREYRAALNRTKSAISMDKGLFCFSKNWNNPVLWGHYADRHRGIGFGFDMPDDLPRQVSYVNSRFNWPTEIDQSFMTQLLFTKFSHWSYEDEYRVYVNLEDRDGDFYYFDFCEKLVLKRVIVGPSSPASWSDIEPALGDLSPNVEVFKARAAFKSFSVIRNKNSRLWA